MKWIAAKSTPMSRQAIGDWVGVGIGCLLTLVQGWCLSFHFQFLVLSLLTTLFNQHSFLTIYLCIPLILNVHK
jgi:hypothetical protein